MKTKTFLLVCLLSCSAIQAQDIDLTGTWTMFEMTWTNGQNINKTSEDQLKADGAFSDYFLMPEGKFKLVSNMTGSGNTDTYEGTWKLDGNKLVIGLSVEGNSMDIVWDLDYKDGIMNLKRTSPDGSTSVVNAFRRKEIS